MTQGVDGTRIEVVGPSGSAAEKIAAEADVSFERFDKPGLSAAVNHVWQRHPDVTYYAWLGDDDGLAPGSLRLAAGFLDANPKHTAVYGRCRFVWADGSTYAVTTPGRLAALWLPYGGDRVPQQGTLFRASVVRKVGYLDEALRYAMDYDLLLKLAARGPLGYLPYELGFFRLHSTAISSNKPDTGGEHRFVRDRAHRSGQAAMRPIWSPPAAVADRLIGKVTRHLRRPQDPPRDSQGRPYVGRV